MGYTAPDCAPELSAYKLTQTVLDHAYAKQGFLLSVHIKIDTGMHRLGERADHKERVENMLALEKLKVTGIYTKLACCDSRKRADVEYTKRQLQDFRQLLMEISGYGAALVVHAQCSYGILNYPGRYAYARPGAALYGTINKACCIGDAPPLRPIFEVKTRVAMFREINIGESIGYDRALIAPQAIHIAILSIGYADGLPRSLSSGAGKVLLHGQFAPIIGQVCMDQTIVDITEIDGVVPGDAVTLIGHNGGGISRCRMWRAGRAQSQMKYLAG